MKQFILSLVLFVSFATAQDTVFVAPINSALIAVSQGGQINNISATNISANQYTTFITGVQIAINDGTTEIRRWNIANYIFKVNGVVVSGASNILTAINQLNAGSAPQMRLFKTIKVVSVLPPVQELNTTYFVGRQTTIQFDSLDGNRDQVYRIEGWLIGDTTNDAMAFRVNGITTNNYDYGYGYVGSTSFQTANNANTMNAGSIQGKTSANQVSLYIEAESGKNRQFLWEINTIGVNQQVISRPLVGGGIWRNSVDNLTSIQFTCPSAVLMYGVGTTFRIYRLQ